MDGHASPRVVVGVVVTFTVLAIVCCGLRLYARKSLIPAGDGMTPAFVQHW